MRRGTVLKFTAAVIVIVLTGSSAWAAETWQQLNISRGNFEAARTQTHALLDRFLRAGMAPSARRRFWVRLSAISVDSPSSPSSWRSGIDRYDRARRHIVALEADIRREFRRETSRERQAVDAELRNLKNTIVRAARYGIATQRESRRYAGMRTAAVGDDTPIGLSGIARSASGVRAGLARRAGPLENFVSAQLTSARGAKTGIVSSAQSATAAIDAKLSLLGILTTRAASYHTQESADLAAIQAAPTAFRAAVVAYKLESLRTTVFADFDKTIPTKLIVVSTEQQAVTLYANGRSIYSTVATTGGPELPTFHGVYHIYEKISPFVFHSPFPPSSPYYYYPSPVTYWMPFDGGQGLHDAPWRSNFGPGSNDEPTPLGGGRSILGTHGCVNLPFDAAQYVWNWAPLGTTVAVI